MSRKAARFTEADVTRVLKAAKKAGMSARVNLSTGIIDLGPGPGLDVAVMNVDAEEAARIERSKRIEL
ncbi:hypothetical protein [Azorhizobium caulinodans]|uniref:hypothetical protein n=1 Tax=Azorhizobium caulinodans TaxID=7 RepID=UPI002FBF0001